MKLGSKGLPWQNIFVIVLLAVIGLYLFGEFSVETDDGREFEIPEDANVTLFTVFKMVVVFALVFGVFALFMKLSGGVMTKKEAFTAILIGVGIILLWDKLVPMLNSRSLDEITFSVGQKLGMFKP